MNFGYQGCILRIDLTNDQIEKEQLDEDFYRRYYGGACMIAEFLLKELKPGIDPLGPDNLLIFAAGVITGAPVAGAGRHTVGAKSPLSGGFGKSEAGGFWGTELKKAGFDLIIIKGRSDHPVYISITNDKVEIKDARHIWGKTTKEAQNIIKGELGGNYRIAQIGPGGERLVRFASIIHDLKYVAGRTGLGAVMGSKNLKAVAVKGTGKVNVYNPGMLSSIQKEIGRMVKEKLPRVSIYGTGHDMEASNAIGNTPVRNFNECFFEEAASISAVRLKETMSEGMDTCFACPVRCKKVARLEYPYEVDASYGGPEYETLAAFGGNCGIGDLAAVARAHQLCNAYGLDTISTGVTISFAMECFKEGIINIRDTDGIRLEFGSEEALLQIIVRIAAREGVGDILAEGSKRAAKTFGMGASDLAVHVKGVEMPMHEARLKHGLGLVYAISAHGADHGVGTHDTDYVKKGAAMESIKALGYMECLAVDDLSPIKAALVTDFHKWRYFHDSLVTCYFVPIHTDRVNMFAQPVRILRAVTGWNTTVYECIRLGERAITLARLFNLREGLAEKDDILPPKIHRAFSSGPLQGISVDREKLAGAVKMYYKEMGWSIDGGIPTDEKLESLGLAWAKGRF